MDINICINGESHKHHEKKHYELPLDGTAKEIMRDEEFVEYVKKHGYHFTQELADHASGKMHSRLTNLRSWKTTEVMAAIQSMLPTITNKHHFTDGDFAYVANSIKMDFYPNYVDSEEKCLRMAVSMADDPDGYDGMVFLGYVSDAIGRHEMDIEWV